MSKKIIALVAAQILVLLFMASSHFLIQSTGEEIKLKTAPVDPRDVLYGDYVTLNYDISDINVSYFRSDEKPERGDTVYVLLKRVGNYDELVSAHLEKPVTTDDQKMLKGRIDYVSHSSDSSYAIESVRVLYGFERYYVAEGTGKELEDKRGQFDVIVKVTSWGQTLSRISFIANGVIPQSEATDRVYQHFREKSEYVRVTNTELVDHYEDQNRAVWVVEVRVTKEKTSGPSEITKKIVMNAVTGEILDELQ